MQPLPPSGYSSNPSNTNSSSQTYPFAVPQETQLKNELNISSIVDPPKTKETLLFCHVCDIPMVVRVVLVPCKHIMCYTCYCNNPNDCKLCEEEITSFIRIPDKERIPLAEDETGYPIYIE